LRQRLPVYPEFLPAVTAKPGLLSEKLRAAIDEHGLARIWPHNALHKHNGLHKDDKEGGMICVLTAAPAAPSSSTACAR
jgi:hypothetical protein